MAEARRPRRASRDTPPPAASRVLARVQGRANEPLLLLHFAFRAVTRGPDALLSRHGFGRLHHRVLFFVGRDPDVRVGDLQVALGISKQALHLPLRELVEANLVESTPDVDDARSRRLRLTDAGKTLEDSLSGAQRKLFRAAFRRAGREATDGWRQVMAELAREIAPGKLADEEPLP